MPPPMISATRGCAVAGPRTAGCGGAPQVRLAQDHPHLVLDRAAVARGAQPQLVTNGVVESSDGQAGHGHSSARYDSNAIISRMHCNHNCRTASKIPIKVAAMIQSATVRQRLLRPSARLIAAIVSGGRTFVELLGRARVQRDG